MLGLFIPRCDRLVRAMVSLVVDLCWLLKSFYLVVHNPTYLGDVRSGSYEVLRLAVELMGGRVVAFLVLIF